MNVTICAPFRDGVYLANFIEQVDALDYPHAQLRIVCVEGDSVDDTWEYLGDWAQEDKRVTLRKCDTGQRKYPSIVHPDRFALLAQVFNTALDAVDLIWSDYVLFTPSDVRFDADVLTRLLAHEVDMVAPMFWLGDIFYDVWGMIYRGENFTHFTRQWAADNFKGALLEMDTIGGMILMHADVLRAGCRYTPAEVDQGLCREAQAEGFRCWLDTDTHIEHPTRR